MLHLIYGSALSKKDEMIMNYMIKEAKKNPDFMYTILVPEQMGLSVQDALIKLHPDHALYNMDVLTFNRLSYHVFDELNRKEKDMMDDTGKKMILRLLVSRVKKELRLLKNNLNRPGFLNELKSVMSELVQYNVSPEMLEKEIREMGDQPALQLKMQDILLIYRSFLEEVHKDHALSEERLSHLSELLPHYKSAKKTIFFMTGFTGFTPPQYSVVTELLKLSPDFYLSVPVGSEWKERIEKNLVLESDVKETDLFYMPLHMAIEMKKLAVECFAPDKGYDEIFVEEETKVSSEVKHIEQHLYRNPFSEFTGKTENVTLISAKNRRLEVQAVLSKVLEDIREGYLFSDLAIITGSVETYQDEIEDQFSKAKVPVFFDASRSITKNPLFQLITDLLEVQRLQFSFDETFSYMKNPLMMKWLEDYLSLEGDFLSPYERIAELENYVRATGIRGKGMYEKKWDRQSRKTIKSRLIYIEETKNAMTEPLFPLLSVLSDKEKTVTEKLSRIVLFLEELEVRETLLRLSEETDVSENAFLKAEYLKSYELLMALFQDISEILGEEKLSFEEFEEILVTGIQGLKINIVPPTRNRLIVGDLMRSRLSSIKKLYIIGANEEILLSSPKEGGLLSDLDREYLKGKQIELSETARQEIFNRRFYLYLLLSKPSEKLIMTYSSSSMDGTSLSEAALLEAVRKMFPSLETENVKEDDLKLVSTTSQLHELLSKKLRLGKEQFDANALSDEDSVNVIKSDAKALFSLSSETDKVLLENLLTSACYAYEEPHLSMETALRLYGDVIDGSVSRLEGFSSCAYRHYLSYGLRLSEPEEFRLSEADYGTIFHDSIEAFFTSVEDAHKAWDTLSDKEIEYYVSESVEKIAAKASNEVLRDNARNQYLILRVKRLTLRTLNTLKFQWSQGSYDLTESEKEFKGGRYLPELSFTLDNGRILNLRGRIDRIDTKFTDDGKIYVKIIDYKSGNRELDYTKIYHGIQLQLLVYMEAARALLKNKYPEKEIVPAGVYYYHIDDPIIDMEKTSDASLQIKRNLRMKGMTNVEPLNISYLEKDFYSQTSRVPSVIQSLNLEKTEKDNEKVGLAEKDELLSVSGYAVSKAKALTEEMLSGKISINPYTYHSKSSCEYCPYASVCHFDSHMPGFTERRLSVKTLNDFVGGEKDGVDTGSEESH